MSNNIVLGSDELPILESSIGKNVVSVKSFADMGYWSYDPAFMVTAACESKITYIDGQAGKLLYRGYPIEQLAEHSSHLETAFLLFYGELPTKDQYENFVNDIKSFSYLDANILNIFTAFSHNAHPMSMLLALVSSLSGMFSDYDVLDTKK